MSREESFYAPVEVNEPYEGPPPRKEDGSSRGNEKPWSGYEPECTLESSRACFPVQRENIRPPEIYRGILGGTNRWLDMACKEALRSAQTGGGPFGAVLLQIDDETGKVLRYWKNHNHVTEWKDPTAHAEISVIRRACSDLGVFHLARISRKEASLSQEGAFSHCELYSSAEPCPMCYAAICWARIPVLVFGATRFDAAAEGVEFSDAAIYEEMALAYGERGAFRKILQGESSYSLDAFNYWKRSEKIEY
ncbi:MAG TPA: nucleoside deaminase [Synergistaceae bacterium]|nr:nucleoside deaminase [Synergistaceae bacterium]HPQ36791.1 nucleoside deaminase [Synergistaceae bacterium]